MIPRPIETPTWSGQDARSAELAITHPHPFIVRRAPEQAAPPVAWTLNMQGAILNAVFSSANPADAARLGRFIAEHNAAMADLRSNSKLGDLR